MTTLFIRETRGGILEECKGGKRIKRNFKGKVKGRKGRKESIS